MAQAHSLRQKIRKKREIHSNEIVLRRLVKHETYICWPKSGTWYTLVPRAGHASKVHAET